MRLSEFQRAMREEFGDAYAGVLMRDHWIVALEGTADAAIARGVPAKAVWAAVCEDLDVPPARRYGRGLRDPQT